MKKIGLTGGIGAGKSIIARILATMGFPVFYSDSVGKELLAKDSEIQQQVILLFGSAAYQDGHLNRAFLAKKIFSNQHLKEELNNIVHPAVRKAFSEWTSRQNSEIVFNEAAILFETGSYKNFDATILVSAPKSIRIDRVMKRDQSSIEEVKVRMNNQWSDEEKRSLADFEIINDNKKLLIPQVEKVINQIQEN